MRMVRRIALYIALALLAAVVSIGVAYAAFRLGVPSTPSQWIGLGTLILCLIVIVYFMEFQRS